MAKEKVQAIDTNTNVEETASDNAQVETPSAKDEKEDTKVTKTNGSKSNGYGKRVVKLADMEIIELTKAAFDKLTPAGLVAKMIDPKNPAINRISRERAHAMLIERIEAGRITVTSVILADLTYKNVVVEGVAIPAKVRGVIEPKITLTQEQFDKAEPKEIAAYVDKYTHKRRAADTIIPDYIVAGMPMTAVDVVSLTNGRVAVKGVEVPKAGNAKVHAVTEGIQFG